ncbi:MAG: hypothetical protein JO262_22080 [Solirubrobacterales bacterium]|nr:hypothetical protein [Solirubrobacterales bacterium]
MAMTHLARSLPCGVRLDELLIQVADAAPPADEAHQATCPYCQTALRRLRREWAGVTELAHQPVRVPASLTHRIMSHVRSLAVQASDYILLGHPRGETRISHIVIGRVAQRLVTTVPGIVFASVRVEPQRPPQADRVTLSIQLVVRFGPALHPLAESVRQRVERRTTRLTGAHIERVDVTVNDMAI